MTNENWLAEEWRKQADAEAKKERTRVAAEQRATAKRQRQEEKDAKSEAKRQAALVYEESEWEPEFTEWVGLLCCYVKSDGEVLLCGSNNKNREMATMRVVDQKKNLMLHYKGFINMYLNGTMPYTNDFFPPIPPSLATCERATAFNILMQSKSRSTSVFTKDALFGKVNGNVQRILKFITEWCRKCPSDAARNPGVFVPAEPPSVWHDRDWVFDQIMRAEWRIKPCLRKHKLRVSCDMSQINATESQRATRLLFVYWHIYIFNMHTRKEFTISAQFRAAKI